MKNRSLKELLQVRCSLGWLGLGITLGGLTTLALWQRRWATLATLSAIGATGLSYATLLEPGRPVLERINLRFPRMPSNLEGLRIGQLSDLHLGLPFGKENTRWAVEQMTLEKPDLLVLTGDFVSFHHAIADLPDLLRPLKAPLGIYAVPGNHDHWEGLAEIQNVLQPLGIEFLINEKRQIVWNEGEMWLVGIDDTWYGEPDLPEALQDVPPEAFTILLAHEPDFADTAAKYRIALQLSGHTHGGHLRLPLLGSFCVPFHGTRYHSGFEQVGPLQMYISRGLGGLPLRFNCRPEATIFTLCN